MEIHTWKDCLYVETGPCALEVLQSLTLNLISTDNCNTAVSLLLTQWRYDRLVLSHRYNVIIDISGGCSCSQSSCHPTPTWKTQQQPLPPRPQLRPEPDVIAGKTVQFLSHMRMEKDRPYKSGCDWRERVIMTTDSPLWRMRVSDAFV